jgi:hypothetical protein
VCGWNDDLGGGDLSTPKSLNTSTGLLDQGGLKMIVEKRIQTIFTPKSPGGAPPKGDFKCIMKYENKQFLPPNPLKGA